jgi:hypothetical protein
VAVRTVMVVLMRPQTVAVFERPVHDLDSTRVGTNRRISRNGARNAGTNRCG